MDQNIYTAGGGNCHISKLVFNKFMKLYPDNLLDEWNTEDMLLENVHPEFVSLTFKTDEADIEDKQLFASSSPQKRKFEEINEDNSKFLKISDSSYLKEKNDWEQYNSLKPYTIKCYSSLLPSKSLIPNLMDDGKISHQINSPFSLYSRNFCLSVHSNKSPSVCSADKCFSPLTVEKTCNFYDVQNLNLNSQFDSNSKCASKEGKLINKCKKITNAANDSSESIPSSQMHHKDNFIPESLSFSKSNSAVNPSKHIDLHEADANHDEQIFTTAAGKSINISNNALLAAQRLIQDVFQDETNQKIDREVHCSPIENKEFLKVLTLKKGCVPSFSARNHKDDEIIIGEIDSKSINKNHELGVSYDTDCANFSTAAGNTVDVSKAAMESAHELIQDGFGNKDQIMPFTSGFYNSHKEKCAFKDIGCPPKKLLIEDNDDTLNKALFEKFFEDDVFDEKELQDITESSKDKDFNKVLDSKTNNDPTIRKIRKSLGGRRSMRFYSHA